MGLSDIPYSRTERRKCYFIIHKDVEVPETLKERLKRLARFKFKPSKRIERKCCIYNKNKTQYNFTNDINLSHYFRFDKAVELAKTIKDSELKVSMVKTAGNQFILV